METEPVSARGLRWTRSLFFALCAVTSLRFLAKGWVHEFYVIPGYHFTWPGFEFIRPMPSAAMHGVFVLMAFSASCAAVGLWFRRSAWVFIALFAYVEMLDKTYYLNHHYLLTLVAILFAAGPALGRQGQVPRGYRNLLRFQVGIVYVFAGLAKLDHDFLLRGEPLHTWLLHHAALPVIGRTMALPGTASAMSWAGTVFDLGVVPALLYPRSLPFAYAAIIVFHLATGLLFGIGMFPGFMIVLATVFFPSDWPTRLPLSFSNTRTPTAQERASPQPIKPGTRWALQILTAAYVTAQILIPLRHFAYPGHTNWTEEGFRFAWRVMLFEKTGHVEFHVEDSVTGKIYSHPHRELLTRMQAQMMSTQPDMLAQYARHIAVLAQSTAGHPHRAFADTRVSLNGAPPMAILDPVCNLASPWPLFWPAPCIVRD